MIRGRAHRPQRRGEPFGPLRIPIAPQLVANAVAGHEQTALDRPTVESLPVLPVRITGGRVQPAENVAQFVAIPGRLHKEKFDCEINNLRIEIRSHLFANSLIFQSIGKVPAIALGGLTVYL